jgi:hypothetical protein
MKIIRILILTAFNILLLFILMFAVAGTDDLYLDAGEAFPHSTGDATGAARASIQQQLNEFQAGYTQRDVSRAEAFAARLFSPDILILGTLPEEVFIGQEQAAELVESDWRAWGDCRFLMENAQISAAGQAAWFSTIGTVLLDGVNITLPLRLTGVLAEEDGAWKFQQLQFQFDLKLGFLMLVVSLLLGWLVVNIILVLIQIVRAYRVPVYVD